MDAPGEPGVGGSGQGQRSPAGDAAAPRKPKPASRRRYTRVPGVTPETGSDHQGSRR